MSVRRWTVCLLLFVSFFAVARVDAASLTVKTPFEGQPPAGASIKADADPKCKLMHPDGIASDEAWTRLYGEGGRMDLETAVALIVDIGGGLEELGGVGFGAPLTTRADEAQ